MRNSNVPAPMMDEPVHRVTLNHWSPVPSSPEPDNLMYRPSECNLLEENCVSSTCKSKRKHRGTFTNWAQHYEQKHADQWSWRKRDVRRLLKWGGTLDEQVRKQKKKDEEEELRRVERKEAEKKRQSNNQYKRRQKWSNSSVVFSFLKFLDSLSVLILVFKFLSP